ncbi:MAG: SDR family NAD(P)-dependent oxidoreductase, partial [Gammaproteobacteria bacterium]|nr:SDR family NAD(P)-dependent oxidoreductase [Gammaproteobacteria bacterium]
MDKKLKAYEKLIKQSLHEIRSLKVEVNSLKEANSEPVAIIGMGCRFPGANNPEAFWKLLRDGVDAISEVPKDRWAADACYDPNPEAVGGISVRFGGFVKQLDEFDTQFFRISPQEAASLDPQQRLLLEVSWEALENAAVMPPGARTGVFVGISQLDYRDMMLKQGVIDTYFASGNAHSTASGRLSYFLGLNGPCLSIDTACSSSLVSVHQAIISLRRHECDLALAGGVNRILTPEESISSSKAGMLSPDGRCKAFDAAADGYVRAEGCGMIVLKRLSDAQADGDNILALIRGSAINQDGRTSGLTVPNGPQQVSVIREALADSGADPEQVSYVEAHGTGTSLGDPIEVGALGAVFNQREQSLIIGSVKTNIGHLEAAAGIAGLIKVVLSMQHEEIPPNLHFHQPNPYINWDQLPVSIPTKRIPWSADSRLAGVSSFGFSGTNSHVVLSEAPETERPANPLEPSQHILTLSAKSPEALQELAQRYVAYPLLHSDVRLADICFTANTGRKHFRHRLAVVAKNLAELTAKLAAYQKGETVSGLTAGLAKSEKTKIAFLFTGQGSQHLDMGRELYETHPLFREIMAQCDQILQSYLEKPLLELLYGSDKEENNKLLSQAQYTQPALFAIEYALAKLWQSWGIEPTAVIGHSDGEYVAACVAGVFSLENGLKLIAERGRLMQTLPQNGIMAAVQADETKLNQVIELYRDRVSLAGLNAPQSVMLSGERETVNQIVAQLQAEGIKCKSLDVSHALHSPLMEPMLAEFGELVRSVNYTEPQLKLVSNLSGEQFTDISADYWVEHIQRPVRFAQGIATLADMGIDTFIEIGPKPILLGLGQQCLSDSVERLWLPSLYPKQRSDWTRNLESLAKLHIRGGQIDWQAFDKPYPRRKVSLPTYPFQRKRYWIPAEESPKPGQNPTFSQLHPLLHLNTSDITGPRFSATFSGEEFFLADHRVKGERVLPGVATLEMARAAIERAVGNESEGHAIRLKNIVWARPITVGEEPVEVHISLFPEENGEIAFEITTQPAHDDPVVFSQGSAVLIDPVKPPTLDIPSLQTACDQEKLDSARCYATFKTQGLDYGPGFQSIDTVYAGTGQALAKLHLPTSISDTLSDFILHPSLLDAALQASIGLSANPAGEDSPALPFALESLDSFGPCTVSMQAVIRESDSGESHSENQKIDIDLCDDNGRVCVRMSGFSSRALKGELEQKDSIGTLLLQPCWKEQAVAGAAAAGDYSPQILFLCEFAPSILSALESSLPQARCIPLTSEAPGIAERYTSYAIQVFGEIQRIIQARPESNIPIQAIVPLDNKRSLFSGLAGLLKTARLENPKLICQLIGMDAGTDAALITERVKENLKRPMDSEIHYRDGKRFISDWREIETAPEDPPVPWKEGGVYLITGGAGGLGLIFAQEITARVKHATLILTGRSPSDDRKAGIKALQSSGVKVEYRQADVARKEAVIPLIDGILEDFGALDGILHSAGTIRDSFILKKSVEDFRVVLDPKVAGLVNLDESAKDLALDFFILFSSGAGPMGNIGQADYACANAFMDAYAEYRRTLVNTRQGRTLSVDWPLWKHGGMQVDAASEKMMIQNTGMVPMDTQTGIRALYRSLASGQAQVLAMAGNITKIKQKYLDAGGKTAVHPPEKPVSAFAAPADLDNQVKSSLIRTVSELLKIRAEDIDEDAEWNEFGFDSISLTEMVNQLNEKHRLELMPTLFFEYPTIGDLAEYLTENHAARFAPRSASPVIDSTPECETAHEQPPLKRRDRFSRFSSAKTVSQKGRSAEPVAIVGMSGRFPMAENIDEFWKNLAEGRDCITEIPPDRWDWREWYGDPLTEANKTDVIYGGFIDRVTDFDPLFFGISPKEAERMDPQQRLLMMYAWKAIEDAGYSAKDLAGSNTAVFVGTGSGGYAELLAQGEANIEAHSATGLAPSVGPNRLSYFLDIHGPSEPVETACSSSLVALHRAVSAIENEGCELAIAGGVNTILTPEAHIGFSKAGMLSKDGKCKTFSANADGYVRGEGVGMLLLRRLKDAEQAGDHIYGVILGTAENHGGRASSLTAPNPRAQANLLKAAYAKAGIDPKTISYIETHGTGTRLGDPIEIEGLKAAFKELAQAEEPDFTSKHCGLGSVKSNIGHLELSAGIAGVIKVLLQMKHKTLVKSLHCEKPNPYIKLEESPFQLIGETTSWEPLTGSNGEIVPRRAGVSSFGFGGVNAHVIIEEYEEREKDGRIRAYDGKPPYLIVMSARNEERLREQAKRLLAEIPARPFSDSDLKNIAYTLQVGREAMESRLALLADTLA